MTPGAVRQLCDMNKLKIIIPITIIIYFSVVLSPHTLPLSEFNPSEVNIKSPIVLATESKFTYETIELGTKIPFSTEIQYDNLKDACSEPQIIQTGIVGRQTKEILITYYEGKEYDRQQVAIHTYPSQTEIILKGTQKNFQSMPTDSGTINYWCKLGQFSATAYDATCAGCNLTTAIGLKTGFGVVAVDKTVIPLGSQLYITGYGKAIAGDTGGYIKGRRVDLGFDSIGSWWGRREVEVYLL